MQMQNLGKSFQALRISPSSKLIFPTRGAIFIHLCLTTFNSNWWFGNHWSSFVRNLWELPSEKKKVSSETILPKSPSKPHTKTKSWNLKSPTPVGRSKNKSILPNSSWTFQPPPHKNKQKNLNLHCFSRLWSFSSPPDPLFSWKKSVGCISTRHNSSTNIGGLQPPCYEASVVLVFLSWMFFCFFEASGHPGSGWNDV